MAENNVVYDIAGYEALTPAIMDLINQYPALTDGDEFSFSVLNEDNGKAMFPNTGAIVQLQRVSVTGKVYQECLYPFYIVYRAAGLSENRKKAVKEWLDNLGRWLEKQTIIIDETEYKINEYPTLTGNRKMLAFTRNTPAFLNSVEENQVEDWIINIQLRYSNEFKRI